MPRNVWAIHSCLSNQTADHSCWLTQYFEIHQHLKIIYIKKNWRSNSTGPSFLNEASIYTFSRYLNCLSGTLSQNLYHPFKDSYMATGDTLSLPSFTHPFTFQSCQEAWSVPQILERLSRHMLSFLLYSLFKSKVKYLHSYLNTFLTSYADFSYHIASSASARLGHSVFFWHSEHRWQNSRANYTKNCLLCFHWSLFTTAKFKADVSHFKCMFHKLPPSHILQFLTTDLHGTEVRKWHQLSLFSLQTQEVGERQ